MKDSRSCKVLVSGSIGGLELNLHARDETYREIHKETGYLFNMKLIFKYKDLRQCLVYLTTRRRAPLSSLKDLA